MDAKRFAWLYLIEQGQGGCKHSYYGGYEMRPAVAERFNDRNSSSWDIMSKINAGYIEDIKKVGVNWDKTEAPRSDDIGIFDGTFAENNRSKEIIFGTLVLNDGSEQEWSADAIEIDNVFEMMADVANSQNRFYKIFHHGGYEKSNF